MISLVICEVNVITTVPVFTTVNKPGDRISGKIGEISWSE
jgi:hypothetical protein